MASEVLTFEVEGLDEINEALRRSPEEIRVALNHTLRDIGQMLVPPLKEATPIGATKNLRNKTVFQVKGLGDDQTLEIRQGARSGKGYFYGAAVRGGTRPHFPPSDALVPWVQKKLGVPATQAKGVAFLVARKMSRVGTKPNPYHVEVLGRHRGDIQAIVNKYGVKVAGQLAQT